MSVPVVAICRAVLGELSVPGAEVRLGGERAFSRAELLSFVRGASVIVPWVSEKIDTEVLEAAGLQLKGVCNYAVGVDNIDLAACRACGVIVTNTPNAVTEGTADMAWALLLAVARRVVEGDRFARSPEYAARGPLGPTELVGMDLTGKTLLIVGAGRIGFATAMRSRGWGMRVLYVARTRHWDFELAPLAAERVTLEEGLARADVVSVHCPLTPETRGLMNAEAFGAMKPGAIFINTARGPIHDEQALVDALKSGRLYGAGLDVFEREPKVHEDLKGLSNVVLTPHIGSAEARYRAMMTAMALENARAILAGETPPNRVA